MRSGDVDGAVSSGVAAMLTTITPSYSAVSPPPEESTAPPVVTGGLALSLIIFALLALLAAIAVILRIVYAARYGYLMMREGSKKAKADMKNSAFWTVPRPGSLRALRAAATATISTAAVSRRAEAILEAAAPPAVGETRRVLQVKRAR